MRSGTNPNIVKRKLNGRRHHTRFVAGQQIQVPQAASEKEIKASLNNVIQDIQLSPRISMVTNVPACTVSLAHQAVTQKKQKRKIFTSPTRSDSRSSSNYSWSSSIWFPFLTDNVSVSQLEPDFPEYPSICLETWHSFYVDKNPHFYTCAPLTVSVHHGNTMETQQNEQTPTQATALWRGTFPSTATVHRVCEKASESLLIKRCWGFDQHGHMIWSWKLKKVVCPLLVRGEPASAPEQRNASPHLLHPPPPDWALNWAAHFLLIDIQNCTLYRLLLPLFSLIF